MFGRSLTVPAGTADNLPATTQAVKLPAALVTSIQSLLVTYQTGNMAEEDYRLVVGAYVGVGAQHDAEMVALAVSDLMIDNPRNPFRPTPQDLHQACLRRAERVQNFLCLHFTVEDRIVPSSGPIPLPFTPEWTFCSKEYIMKVLVKAAKGELNAFQPQWGAMSDKTLERWPKEVLKEVGIVDEIKAARKKRAELLAERAKRDLADRAEIDALYKEREAKAAAEMAEAQKRDEERKKILQILFTAEAKPAVKAAIDAMDAATEARDQEALEAAYNTYYDAMAAEKCRPASWRSALLPLSPAQRQANREHFARNQAQDAENRRRAKELDDQTRGP